MALSVEKLNDDTTFLLAFAPPFAPKKTGRKFPGAFTILLDPWLSGHSSVWHKSFQISTHTTESAIKSLTELEQQPDLIIVSQDKPDHCHRETLCSLPQNTATPILATPAAAKKIRSWKHFDPSVVHVLRPYNAQRPDTVAKISLPAYTSTSASGEITIANIVTKRDITALHNAIAITYRPPASLLSASDAEVLNLTALIKPRHVPTLRKARSAYTLPSPTPTRPRAASSPRIAYLDPQGRLHDLPEPPSPPPVPSIPNRGRADSKTSLKSIKPITLTHKEKPLSVLYTPHGISLAVLDPYLRHHHQHHRDRDGEVRFAALLHSLNTEENPWFMGGLVANGAPGGVLLAQELRPKCWIGAHDEVKDNKGWATAWIKSRAYGLGEVRGMLEDSGIGAGKEGTEVKCLGVGERMWVDG